jgi:hypothetical protein
LKENPKGYPFHLVNPKNPVQTRGTIRLVPKLEKECNGGVVLSADYTDFHKKRICKICKIC